MISLLQAEAAADTTYNGTIAAENQLRVFSSENEGQPVMTAPASMELKVVGLKAVMTVPLEFVNGTNWSPASTALQESNSGRHGAANASGKARSAHL